MIVGKLDTYYTVAEFAAMVGRSEKTIRNWASEGRVQFAQLCGVDLVSLTMVESLITGRLPHDAGDGVLALKLTNRIDRQGRRTKPERHASITTQEET